MPESSLRLRSGSSAKALLLTILGEFVLPHDGSAWTSTLVGSLEELDVAERNARQALARLRDQGLIAPERHGRRTRWHLTAPGAHLLTVGTERIYGFGNDGDRWDRQWLVVFSPVPEEQRAKRHQLRSQLEFAGFGFLGSGVAVSPHVDREDVANAVLRDLGLVDSAVVFRATIGSLYRPEDLLGRAWDVESIAAGYEQFIDAFQERSPTLHRPGSPRSSISSTSGGDSRSATPRSPRRCCLPAGPAATPSSCSTSAMRPGRPPPTPGSRPASVPRETEEGVRPDGHVPGDSSTRT